METTIESNYLIIHNKKVHYLEAGRSHLAAVLVLPGAGFSAQTWWDLGTLTLLAKNGYRAVAIDLPGYGKSETQYCGKADFLPDLLESLNIVQPVIVSHSMSGLYSLPLVVNHPEKLNGFVAVAPVRIDSFEAQLRGNTVPTLAIWGSDDNVVPVAQAESLCQLMPNAEKIILENAGHACYMRATNEFHEHLLEFVERCHSRDYLKKTVKKPSFLKKLGFLSFPNFRSGMPARTRSNCKR